MLNVRDKFADLDKNDIIFGCVVLTFLLLPTGTAPPLITLGIALAVWVFSGKFIQIISVFKPSLLFPVIPFLVLPWLGLLYSQNMELGLDYALKTKYWVIVFVSAGLSLDKKRFETLINWFWVGLTIGAILAFLQVASVIDPVNDGHLGFGVVHTLVSMYLIIGVLTVSFQFSKINTWKHRFLLLFFLVAFLFHLAVLRSRSSYIIFAMLSPMVINNLMYNFSRKIQIGTCLLLMVAFFASPIVRDEMARTYVHFKISKEKILKGEDVVHFPRIYITKEALLVIKKNPLVGIGTGSLTEPTRLKGEIIHHPHNNILYMGTSYGIFGIAACFWLFGTMFFQSWQSRDSLIGYYTMSTCIVLFLAGMFDTPLLNTGTLVLLALSYGFINHLKPENHKQMR